MVISRLRRFPSFRIAFESPEPPIRAELFSVERLEQHAESLAKAQTVAPSRRSARLLAPRLYENSTVLEEAYRDILAALEIVALQLELLRAAPEEAIAPGQACVFYAAEGSRVLSGGWITVSGHDRAAA